MMTLDNLTQDGREELALMILLWKDFKCQGKFDPDITIQALTFAKMFGVEKEFEQLFAKLPPTKIEPRYK